MTNFDRVVGLMGASVVAIACASPAMAQTRTYSIPAQSAAGGVAALARQSDQQVLISARDAKGKKTAEVRGDMTIEQAFAKLLAGSGLTVKRTGAGAWAVVQGGNGQSGANSAATGKAEVSGTVTDATTGRRLVGALVRLAPSGQTAVTDEQGQYRIVGVPSGDVAVTVSFLGLTTQQQDVAVGGGEGIDVDFAMGVGEDIIVYGTRSARSLALNRERTSENSQTVISSDLLGNFGGTTISDALRRAPGVTFIQNPQTGEGSNIIVRGLSPDYNQVKLNGTDLPDGSGVGRSADLSNILASSVSNITISKTLLPSQDSAGTGGLVEIETTSPLDRPKRYASFGIQGFKNAGDFGDGFLASGTVSARFGADHNFGLSASVQYRKDDTTNSNFSANTVTPGPWLPLLPSGQPAVLGDIDPRTPFPFEEGAEDLYGYGVNSFTSRNKVDTLTSTLSAEWQVSDATNLKLDYVRSKRTGENFSVGLNLSESSTYALMPVPALNGEVRNVVVNSSNELGASSQIDYSKLRETTDSFSFRGTTQSGPLKLDYRAGFAVGARKTPFSYFAAFTNPFLTYTPELFLPEAIDSRTGVFHAFLPRTSQLYPVPLLTDAGFSQLYSNENSRFVQAATILDQKGKSRNLDASLSGRYDFSGGVLKYLEVGGAYTKKRFTNFFKASSSYYQNYNTNVVPTAADLGLEFETLPYSMALSGPAAGLQPTQVSSLAFFRNLDRYVSDDLILYEAPPSRVTDGDNFTVEGELVGWAQSRIDIGKLEIVGGARLSSVRVHAGIPNFVRIFGTDGQIDEAYREASQVIVDAKATQTAVLPRVLINWRPDERLVLRAGYFSSVARPQISLLNSDQTITLDLRARYGPARNQPILYVQRGNENLKPARTDNFDVSAEYYFDDAGVIKIAGFYKSIANLVEQNQSELRETDDVALPDDPRFQTPNLYVQLLQPFNNPDRGKIWGFEAAVERQLTFLPGILSGLGVYANYTYTDSRKTEPRTWFQPVYDADGNYIDTNEIDYIVKRPLTDQPKHSGTIGLTYNKYGFDGSLYYTRQSRRQAAFGGQDYGLDAYTDGSSSLDGRLEYRLKLGFEARIFVEGRNLLKGRNDPSIQTSLGGSGVPRSVTSASYLGGRSLRGGISIDF